MKLYFTHPLIKLFLLDSSFTNYIDICTIKKKYLREHTVRYELNTLYIMKNQ